MAPAPSQPAVDGHAPGRRVVPAKRAGAREQADRGVADEVVHEPPQASIDPRRWELCLGNPVRLLEETPALPHASVVSVSPEQAAVLRSVDSTPPDAASIGRWAASVEPWIALRDVESVYVSYYPDIAIPGAVDGCRTGRDHVL